MDVKHRQGDVTFWSPCMQEVFLDILMGLEHCLYQIRVGFLIISNFTRWRWHFLGWHGEFCYLRHWLPGGSTVAIPTLATPTLATRHWLPRLWLPPICYSFAIGLTQQLTIGWVGSLLGLGQGYYQRRSLSCWLRE